MGHPGWFWVLPGAQSATLKAVLTPATRSPSPKTLNAAGGGSSQITPLPSPQRKHFSFRLSRVTWRCLSFPFSLFFLIKLYFVKYDIQRKQIRSWVHLSSFRGKKVLYSHKTTTGIYWCFIFSKRFHCFNANNMERDARDEWILDGSLPWWKFMFLKWKCMTQRWYLWMHR